MRKGWGTMRSLKWLIVACICLYSMVGGYVTADAASGGWKNWPSIEFEGDQTANITSADVSYRHYFGFLGSSAHNTAFELPWTTVGLPYNPPAMANPYHGGSGISDWAITAPAYTAATDTTSLSLGLLAQADAPSPSVTHFEVVGCAQVTTWADIEGTIYYNQAGNMSMVYSPLPSLFPSGVSSVWCDVDVLSDIGEANSFSSELSLSLDDVLMFSLTNEFTATEGSWVTIEDGVGLTLSSPTDGRAYVSAVITDPNDSANDRTYWASLENGVFQTSSDLAPLPWTFTYDGSDIVEAFLAPGTGYEETWESPVIAVGSHDFCASGTGIAYDEKVVPEPTTLSLIGLGILLAIRRKRR